MVVFNIRSFKRVLLNKRFGGGEGFCPAEILRKYVPDQGNSQCKGPRAEMFLVRSGNSQKASMNRAARAREDGGDEKVEVAGPDGVGPERPL